MEFTVTVSIPHPPSAVQDAFVDPEFLAVTGRLPRIGGTEVLECTRDDRAARVRVRYRFTAPLSRPVAAVVDPAKLTWVDDAHVDLVAMRAEHVMLPDHYADRLESTYLSRLTPHGDGTLWTVTGSLVVHAPLVGGRVAAVIVDGLREHATARGAAVDRWLTERH